jgi:outer membrane lipoprotein-sorting protein
MLRNTLALALLLLVSGQVLGQDAAQELYEAMELKLVKAKAHRFSYELDGMHMDTPLKAKGVLILASGNRVKLTFEGTNGKTAIKITIVSDGKTQQRHREIDGKADVRSSDVHDKCFAFLAVHLSRVGAYNGILELDSAFPENPGHLKLSGFKLLGKEKIDGRETNAIGYQMTHRKWKVTCKLWLDAQTNLPVKRIVEGDIRMVETYSRWELDPKLPAETFTLPK